MLSVKKSKNVMVIKNSKFIALMYHVDSIDDINKYLINVKNEYKNATHYCYAYILDGVNKCSDDGEPSGTAGVPMLDVLIKNNLDHVLCIVVRYFGKILLGAGGLVRAYSRSVSECLVDNIVELKKGYNAKIYFDYGDLKKIDYLLNGVIINNKEFDEKVVYNINVDCDKYDELLNCKMCNIEIIKSIYL